MRLNVGVIFGGKSVEHEVSIISALQMIENMNGLKYNPIPIYLSKDNVFYYHDEMKEVDYFKDIDKVKKSALKVCFKNNRNKHEVMAIRKNKLKKLFAIDVIFLVVHGTNCEDGTLSAYFELLDIPYVGSSVLSSALNQNKWKFKQILAHNNISIVPYFGFYENEFDESEKGILEKCDEIGYPLIIKPATLGSSVGITKCKSKEECHQGLLTALQYDEEIIVEKVIENLIELNCSVLGDYTGYETSAIERVFQQDEILSYQDKYLRGSKSQKGMENTIRELPAEIDENLKMEIETNSIKAAKLIGTRGVIRIDYLYDNENKKLYLNEINTIPGSLSFYLWRAKKVTYKELIDRLIGIALNVYRRKNSKIFSYETNLLSITQHFNKGKLLK